MSNSETGGAREAVLPLYMGHPRSELSGMFNTGHAENSVQQ